MAQTRYTNLIIGGGFFGASLALHLKSSGESVAIVEQETKLLQRASLNNQARVHGGYHYPRSIVTGLRSRESLARFTDLYRECVDNSFTKYYAIARQGSSVSAHQFELFCQRISAPLKPATPQFLAQAQSEMIEAAFVVEEYAFDAEKLRQRVTHELLEQKVPLYLGQQAIRISQGANKEIQVTIAPTDDTNGEHQTMVADKVFLCLYGATNLILEKSQLPLVPLRIEFAEMCLVEPPDFLRNAALTVMCGPFFSLMPYPAKNLYTLSHVRYTPHFTWQEPQSDGSPLPPVYNKSPETQSKFMHMRQDAARYFPALSSLKHQGSLWETKALLPRNDGDDARPILLKKNHGLPNLTCIVGAKIDNIFDVFYALNQG